MQSKYKTLKICLVIFCLLRSLYALGLPEFDGATFFMKKPIKDRLLEKVMFEPNTGCWIWTASFNKQWGYGTFGFNGKNRLAHRVSYQLHKGEIPNGKIVCHQCDNVLCVNPDHLYIGTNQDNSNDVVRRKRKTKLSQEVVNQIFQLSELGVYQKIIASKFSICQMTVSLLVNGKIKTWKR